MAKYHDWIVEELETDQDHVHICLSAPPRYSPSKIVNLLKTWTYKHVYRTHPELKEYLWGGKMWAEGYYISTVSDSATKEEIKNYIRQQKRKQKQLKLI
jgi:putative transposase